MRVVVLYSALIQYTVLSDIKGCFRSTIAHLQSKILRLLLSCVVVNYKIMIFFFFLSFLQWGKGRRKDLDLRNFMCVHISLIKIEQRQVFVSSSPPPASEFGGNKFCPAESIVNKLHSWRDFLFPMRNIEVTHKFPLLRQEFYH